ncbi:hypothetical protein D7W82_31175 [Corallococcus sp. CA049B]|nr:hypothetical protein D7W82_31175 [Corallococcus sp. CA049B]
MGAHSGPCVNWPRSTASPSGRPGDVPREGSRPHRRRPSPRWVVERTHSWLNRFRRLLVRWEKREDTYWRCRTSR